MKKKIIILAIFLLFPIYSAIAISVPNPLPNVNSIPDLIANFIRAILGIVGALSLFFVFQGGITWMTSRGNADKVKAGRDTMLWAIFGLVAVFLSYFVINVVLTILQGAG
ncbi:MAG: hypothetical protein PHO91_01295 [Patescibacteria group bacterium]|nr:hypothetical protein [Patescibacteria group bacterium]